MDQDALALLEEKILRAMETIAQLRKEKEAAAAEAAITVQLKSQIATLEHELETARCERDGLKADKEEVRKRVEKLLAQLDTLSA